ncbi:hypothetical protein ASG56_09480 [Rhodococcus sp. Leaf7]|nr:hypothetical protein ASG56_09480 [Rhodococcus sp. Leaf7]KQU39905.1 hypothetical protein ASG64_09475 [Rhodococcus sp. Leaf247]
MASWMTVLVVLVVLLGGLAAAFLYRLVILRRGGTAVILRSIPASEGSGWRHGIVRYGDDVLLFYKLSSLRPGPDRRMPRQTLVLGDRRRPERSELDIMSDEIAVVSLEAGERRYEIAFERGAFTAFTSWLESRPSGRSQRQFPGGTGTS